MSSRTRVGLVGCGRWGKYILRDLVALGCEVHVVAASTESVRNAHEYQADHIVPCSSQLDPDLDGYVVATPTSLHAETIDLLLARKRPIFTEKPLTNDHVVAARLARAAPKQLFVMDKWRYHPGINAIAELIHSAELGTLQSLQLRRLQWGSPHQDVDPVWILLPHDLSIVLHLLGDIPPPSFASALNDNGWMSSITAHLSGPVRVSIEVSAHSMQRDRLVSAKFSMGAAMMADPMADHILIQRGDAREAKEPPLERRMVDTMLPLLLELKAFVTHLQGGPAPLSSAGEGALIVERLAQCRNLASVSA